MDAWDKFVAFEDLFGGLQVGQIGVPSMKRVVLPLGPLPNPRVAAFSPDGKFLAVSVKSRGDIWDLESGKQISVIRPFRSAWFDEGDHLFVQFTKYIGSEPTEQKITLAPVDVKNLAKYEEGDRQYHDLQFRFKPMGEDKSVRQHATLEMKKIETQVVAWSRGYPRETPVCWPAEDNRLVLAWDLSDSTAKSEIKNYPELQRQA
jgi:WD40 repeat protein